MKGIKLKLGELNIALLHHIDEEGREITGLCSDIPGMKCYTKEDKDAVIFDALLEAFKKLGFEEVEKVE